MFKTGKQCCLPWRFLLLHFTDTTHEIFHLCVKNFVDNAIYDCLTNFAVLISPYFFAEFTIDNLYEAAREQVPTKHKTEYDAHSHQSNNNGITHEN